MWNDNNINNLKIIRHNENYSVIAFTISKNNYEYKKVVLNSQINLSCFSHKESLFIKVYRNSCVHFFIGGFFEKYRYDDDFYHIEDKKIILL